MRSSRLLLGLAALLICVMLWNTRLLSGTSVWCDQRVQKLAAEKDASVRLAISQMEEALAQQEASVEAVRAERGAARALRRRLDRLARTDRKLKDLLHAAESARAGGRGGEGEGGVNGESAPAEDSSSSSSSSSRSRSDGSAAQQQQQQPQPEQPQPEQPQPSAGGALLGRTLVPSAMAVVVIAYNRPQYLDRALKSIYAAHPGGEAFPVYVSIDGGNSAVAAVATRHGARTLTHERSTIVFDRKNALGVYLAKFPGYAYLSVHYGWAMRTLFADPRAYEGVIILEEDIEIAPDFFS